MNPALQQLKDIHLPPAISLWPPAPGWFGLTVLILFMLIYMLVIWRKHRIKQYPMKFALKKLINLKKLASDNPENVNIPAEISTLLRRTALHYYPREMIAGLTGQAWLKFLTKNDKNIVPEVENLLIEAPYRKGIVTDFDPLFAFAEEWVVTIAKQKSHLSGKN